MSQNRNALQTVAKACGYGHLLLRPLSAGCLPPTAMELNGLVDRALLPAFCGRSRKPQMELAAQLGLDQYPPPGGGCLLTDPAFSRRLRDLLQHSPACGLLAVELLKHGRHLRLTKASKLVVGRNHDDNIGIANLLAAYDSPLLTLQLAEAPGPLAVFMGDCADLEMAASALAAYGSQTTAVAVKAGDEILKVESWSRQKVLELTL
jgi:hypothetical protein